MWLFLPFGFFSVVAHRTKPDTLLVRSRAQIDLVRLLDHIKRVDSVDTLKILDTPHADYHYRCEIPRAVLGSFMLDFISTDLDFDNFKNKVAETDLERERVYHDVWGVLRNGIGPTRGHSADEITPRRDPPSASPPRGGSTSRARRRAG